MISQSINSSNERFWSDRRGLSHVQWSIPAIGRTERMAASHMERVLSPRIYQRPAICYVYTARGEINRSNWATIGHDSKFWDRIRDNSLCTLPRSSLLSRVHVFVHEIEIEIRGFASIPTLSPSVSHAKREIENLFFLFPFFYFVFQKGKEKGFFWEDFSYLINDNMKLMNRLNYRIVKMNGIGSRGKQLFR